MQIWKKFCIFGKLFLDYLPSYNPWKYNALADQLLASKLHFNRICMYLLPWFELRSAQICINSLQGWDKNQKNNAMNKAKIKAKGRIIC